MIHTYGVKAEVETDADGEFDTVTIYSAKPLGRKAKRNIMYAALDSVKDSQYCFIDELPQTSGTGWATYKVRKLS